MTRPSANDGSSWLVPLELALRLATDGVLLLVDQAQPGALPLLLRRLLSTYPELVVLFSAVQLGTVREGSVVILCPQSAEATWLNLNRPLLTQRALRVILFCDSATAIELFRLAPDFFDWISRRVAAPPVAPPHVVAGLRALAQSRQAGAVYGDESWRMALAEAFPQRRVQVLSAAEPYDRLREILSAGPDTLWVVTAVSNAARLLRIRWALAELRVNGPTVLLRPAIEVPGWWLIHGGYAGRDDLARLSAARRPGLLAGLLGFELEALECCAQLLRSGANEEALITMMQRADDPGAALACHVAPDWEAVERATAASPQLRARFQDPEVARRRQARWSRLKRATEAGAPSPQDATICAADLVPRTEIAPAHTEDGIWPLGEILLRLHAPDRLDARWLAACARHGGAQDVARRWDGSHPEALWRPTPGRGSWTRVARELRALLRAADEQPYGYDEHLALRHLLDLAFVLRGLGDPLEALGFLGTAALIEPRLEVLRELAEVHLSQAHFEDARRVLERAGSAGFLSAGVEDLGPEVAIQGRLDLCLGNRSRALSLWKNCCGALASGVIGPPGRRALVWTNVEGAGLDTSLLLVRALQEVRDGQAQPWTWQVVEPDGPLFLQPRVLHVSPDGNGPLLFAPGASERWDAELQLAVLHSPAPPDREWLARVGSFGRHLTLHVPMDNEVVLRSAMLDLYGALDSGSALKAAQLVVRRSVQRNIREEHRPRLYLPPRQLS